MVPGGYYPGLEFDLCSQLRGNPHTGYFFVLVVFAPPTTGSDGRSHTAMRLQTQARMTGKLFRWTCCTMPGASRSVDFAYSAERGKNTRMRVEGVV